MGERIGRIPDSLITNQYKSLKEFNEYSVFCIILYDVFSVTYKNVGYFCKL